MIETDLNARATDLSAPSAPTPAEANPADAAAFTDALTLASAAAPRDDLQRLRDGVVSLSGTPANWGSLNNRVSGTQTFSEWLNSGQPFPGFDKVTMNCYEWIALGGMKSGAINRDEARAWRDGIASLPPSDHDGKRAQIFGDNPFERIDVAYTRASGEWRVGRVEAPNVQPGQVISIDGAEHVMVVTGRDDAGRILVASFPTVVFGDGTTAPIQDAKPYAGTLEGFLNANLQNFEQNDDRNLFLNSIIVVGDPAFAN